MFAFFPPTAAAMEGQGPFVVESSERVRIKAAFSEACRNHLPYGPDYSCALWILMERARHGKPQLDPVWAPAKYDHPDWQDKVAIVPLSIDDTMQIVRAHVDKRGWTNTFNVWVDEGGWRSGLLQGRSSPDVARFHEATLTGQRAYLSGVGHVLAFDLGNEKDQFFLPIDLRQKAAPFGK
jgi:hypothetical protein